MSKPPVIASKALIGSHAYGLNDAASDKDFINIFTAPTLKIAGMDWQAKDNTFVEIDKGADNTYYEVAHFFKMIQKGNPKTLEVIFSPEISEDYQEILFWLRQYNFIVFPEKVVREAAIGFVTGLTHELKSKPGYKFKTARTALLMSAGIQSWLQTGEYKFDRYDTKLIDFIQNTPKSTMIDLLESEKYRIENVRANPKLAYHKNYSILKTKLKQIRLNNV